MRENDIFIEKKDVISITTHREVNRFGEIEITCKNFYIGENAGKTKIIPTEYIINEGATILFWKDGTKTIVKKTKKDKYNKRLSFLIAYFQKNSGLSKTQANKYLNSLRDENELKFLEL